MAKTKRGRSKPKTDHAQAAVDAVIAALETGVPPWRCSWATNVGLPKRSTGEAYRGINVFVLLARAVREGWGNPYWFTYRQAEALDAQVRKGSKATPVYYYGTVQTDDGEDEDDPRARRFMRTFHVFNAAQIDGLPDRYDVVPPIRPDLEYGSDAVPDTVEPYFAAIPAQVVHGGSLPCYQPSTDVITMPPIETFAKRSLYWSTLAHEVAHWTGGKTRLARTFGTDRAAYAYEELIAELTSVMVGTQLGLPADHMEDHAGYLEHWIDAMRADRTILFKAAAHAQTAFDLMNSYQEGADAEPLPMAA